MLAIKGAMIFDFIKQETQFYMPNNKVQGASITSFKNGNNLSFFAHDKAPIDKIVDGVCPFILSIYTSLFATTGKAMFEQEK